MKAMKTAMSCRWVLFMLLHMVTGANAQAYPERPVTIVVPYAAGGGIDAPQVLI
jgi:tripartite-type tricarboxylate transporter receptor subunit TctC